MKVSLQPWRQLGVSARLIILAVVPVVLLFTAGTYYSYHARLAEAMEDLADQGTVVSGVVAESSEYGLASGNYADLENIANSMVQSDRNIAAIDILNDEGTVVVHATPKLERQPEAREYVVAVKRRTIEVPDFQLDGLPHVSGDSRPAEATKSGLVGYVRVKMSSTELRNKQSKRILAQSLISLLTLGISILFALVMASRLNRPIATTIGALQAIREGDYGVRVAVDEGGEIGGLLHSINDMAVALNEAKSNLEEKVAARTMELEESRNEALKANSEKRKLIQKVDSAVEDERKSIAIEIHDELNATLLAVRLNSQSIHHLTGPEQYPNAQNEIRERAQAIIDSSGDLYASARKIVRRLRPEVLDILGLQGAAAEMLHSYEKLHPECSVKFQSTGDFTRIGGDLAIAAYRLIQEALNNIAKHTSASRVTVSLIVDEQEGQLHISIVDNGAGFEPVATNPGIGLIGMRERVYAFNGTIDIASEKGAGTAITITMAIM